jgi:hypothetical protein
MRRTCTDGSCTPRKPRPTRLGDTIVHVAGIIVVCLVVVVMLIGSVIYQSDVDLCRDHCPEGSTARIEGAMCSCVTTRVIRKAVSRTYLREQAAKAKQ